MEDAEVGLEALRRETLSSLGLIVWLLQEGSLEPRSFFRKITVENWEGGWIRGLG